MSVILGLVARRYPDFNDFNLLDGLGRSSVVNSTGRPGRNRTLRRVDQPVAKMRAAATKLDDGRDRVAAAMDSLGSVSVDWDGVRKGLVCPPFPLDVIYISSKCLTLVQFAESKGDLCGVSMGYSIQG